MAGGFNANTRLKQLAPLTPSARLAGGGNTSTLQLPKTGFLASLYIAVRGSLSAAGTPNALGFASLINRVRLTLNSGIDLINVSGPGYHYLLRPCLDSEYIDILGQSNARSAVAATTFNVDLILPTMINLRDPTGLVLLQNEQTIATLNIDWNTDASVSGNGTVTLTTFEVIAEVFTVPADPQDWPDLSIVHQILEDQQQVPAAGLYTYTLPRGGVYMQLLHGLGIGAAGADGFTNYYLQVNQSDYINYADIPYLDMHWRRMRGTARLPGVIAAADFLATSGLGNYGLMREVFDSNLVTQINSQLQATGAGTLYSVRRQLLRLGAG
jgi:hypothetical protein